MTKNELLTFCMVGCGNNMHIECTLKWISHKTSQSQKITCPLCRVEWNSSYYKSLEKQAITRKQRELVEAKKIVMEESKKRRIQTGEPMLPDFIDNGMTINRMVLRSKNEQEELKKIVRATELYSKKPPKDFKVRKVPTRGKVGLITKKEKVNPLESLFISGFQTGGSVVMPTSNVISNQPIHRGFIGARSSSKGVPKKINLGITHQGFKGRYKKTTKPPNFEIRNHY